MPEIYQELSQRISSEPQFATDSRDLFLAHYFSKLESAPAGLATQTATISAEQMQRLCQVATILACSPDVSHQKAAYELSTQLLEFSGSEYQALASIARLVLARTGNIPSLEMVAAPTSAPLPLGPAVESLVHRVSNSETIGSQTIEFTDFQLSAWERLRQGTSVSISAPTSAGKTFLMIAYITSVLRERAEVGIVVIVPTRALIRQHSSDLQESFTRFGVESVQTWTSSANPPDTLGNRNLFVMTPERLQFVLANWSLAPNIHLLVVDEAQKIADGARGILLEDTILELVQRNPQAQVVFLSPLARDPERLLQHVEQSTDGALLTESSPVSQYVFSVTTRRRRLSVDLLRTGSDPVRMIDYTPAAETPTRLAERLAYIARELGAGSQNLIYANRPTDAEDIAKALASYHPISTQQLNIAQTVTALREYIHDEYSLNACLTAGTAYHHSAMPDIAKLSVEDLFRSGDISYVASTSTLLEGVNLPASNIFVYQPRQGAGNDMTDSSFWNLAGRAGRLLKDFSGNVYCVDETKWETPVMDRAREYSITSAFEQTLDDQDLLNYMNNYDSVPDDKSQSYTYIVNTLVTAFSSGSTENVTRILEQRAPSRNPSKSEQISAKIVEIAENVSIPIDLATKNKSVDIRRQQHALNILMDMEASSLLGMIPNNPFSNDFFRRMARIFAFIGREIRIGTDNPQSITYFTAIAIDWVRENTLKSLINSRLQRRAQGKASGVDVNREIRSLVRDIESKLRFTYVRGTKCFVDLVEFTLQQRSDLVAQGDDFGLPYYLELGMCREGTIALHNLGLSRTTSIAVSELARANGVREDGVLAWLRGEFSQAERQLARPCARELAAFRGKLS
ncbi:MAG: DEAD/DEAH box helicase [Dehalococcoidia bacterium]